MIAAFWVATWVATQAARSGCGRTTTNSDTDRKLDADRCRRLWMPLDHPLKVAIAYSRLRESANASGCVAIQRSELVLRRRLTVAPRDTTSRDGMCAQSVRYPELAMVDGGRPTTCAWSAAIGLDLRCYRVANSLAHQPADVGLDSAGGNPTALPDLHA